MHGKNGEDGTIQGLFELARIPYVGCGVLGSAVCMDKAVANTIMDAAGVPHCKWASAIRAELEGDHRTLLDSIETAPGLPHLRQTRQRRFQRWYLPKLPTALCWSRPS